VRPVVMRIEAFVVCGNAGHDDGPQIRMGVRWRG
jgi:hypothetical protein